MGLFDGAPEAPKIKQQIRELFQELGPVRVEELAQEVIARNLLPDYKTDAILLRGVKEECRRALDEDQADGMPFAKPMGDAEGTWKQVDLFTYQEMAALIDRTSKEVSSDYERLRRYRRRCLARFGKAPEIPQLVALEPA